MERWHKINSPTRCETELWWEGDGLLLLVCGFFCGHRDSNRTLYWSYLSSFLKSAIVMMDDVFVQLIEFVLQGMMNDLARAMRRWTEKNSVHCASSRRLSYSLKHLCCKRQLLLRRPRITIGTSSPHLDEMMMTNVRQFTHQGSQTTNIFKQNGAEVVNSVSNLWVTSKDAVWLLAVSLCCHCSMVSQGEAKETLISQNIHLVWFRVCCASS